jgi:putative transposase
LTAYSHPFVERLIGSIRRELLDQTLFWTATDLENKLREYQYYFNENRTHSGRNGTTPVSPESAKVIDINKYWWENHCRGLFQLPMAA